MRPNQKRPRGRNRRGGGGGGGNTRNQVFDSNGPSGRIRGNAFQIYEKYQNLARDAAVSGDRILAENLYQHAEHYYRIHQSAVEDLQARDDQRRDRQGGGQGGQAGEYSNGAGQDYAADAGPDAGDSRDNGEGGGPRSRVPRRRRRPGEGDQPDLPPSLLPDRARSEESAEAASDSEDSEAALP